jgi:hypothetical protein
MKEDTMNAEHIDGDELAVGIMLGQADAARKQAFLSHVLDVCDGRVECPSCGDMGPHDAYSYMGTPELYCAACGAQFENPGVDL